MTTRVTCCVAQLSLPPPPTAAADATAHAPHAGATCLLPRFHALMLTLHQLLRRQSGLFLARADTRCLYRASPHFYFIFCRPFFATADC